MVLLLRESDVRALLTMPETVRVVDAAFRAQGQRETRNQPRARVIAPDGRGVLHMLSAFVPGLPGHPEQQGPGLVGLKAYTAFAGIARFVVLLFSAEDGRPLAIIEADYLGQMRTGAASGVATRYMAREDAHVLGIIGTGGQARTQVRGVCAVRPITTVLAYGRDPARRTAFCQELGAQVGADVRPVASTEEAVREADILVTATSTREPVLRGAWLRPGTHLNVVGSNWASRREVDDDTIERSAVVAVDALDQARVEAGDLLMPAAARRFDFTRAVELGSIVAGKAPGRPAASAITLFKSLGLGLEDVATAGLIYALAREHDLGTEVDIM